MGFSSGLPAHYMDMPPAGPMLGAEAEAAAPSNSEEEESSSALRCSSLDLYLSFWLSCVSGLFQVRDVL